MRRLKIILLVLLGIYVFGGVILYYVQERFIFLDHALPPDFSFDFPSDFEEVNLSSADGANLHALHFAQQRPKGVILYYHGNAGTLHRWGEVVQYHVRLGYDVIVMDYRGYGKSTGKRSQNSMLADAERFYDYTLEHYSEDQITVYGRSLGTGLATYVSSKHTPKRLMLETPYHDLKSLAQRYYPIFPVGVALRFNFKTNEYIQSVDCPIYIFHGTEDEVVPYKHGQRLYESIPAGKAEFFTIPEGAHKNLIKFAEFRKAVEGVLE